MRVGGPDPMDPPPGSALGIFGIKIMPLYQSPILVNIVDWWEGTEDRIIMTGEKNANSDIVIFAAFGMPQ